MKSHVTNVCVLLVSVMTYTAYSYIGESELNNNADVFGQGRIMDQWRDRLLFLDGGVKRIPLETDVAPPAPPSAKDTFQNSAKRNLVSSGIAYTGLGKRASGHVAFGTQKRVSALGKGSDFLGVGKRVSDVATMDFIGIGKRGYSDESSDDDDSTMVGDLRAFRRRALLRAFFASRRGKRMFDVSRTLKKRPRGKVDLGIAYTGMGRK